MKKFTFTCRRPGCDVVKERYESQRRSLDGTYCSRQCKSIHQKDILKGVANPNFRHGNHVYGIICECGALKDFRSIACALCSNVGFSVGGKPTVEEQLGVSTTKKRRQNMRRLVLKEELLAYRCAVCDNDGTWQGQELMLHLDHINGNPLDNNLSNLRFLCPNCHWQTPTFGSKNKKGRVV